MSGPLVSVVIAVRNGEMYLGAALDSLGAQEIDGLEVIVVDDGSTDGSAAIAASHRLSPVVVSRSHRGQPASLNEGMRLASGEFLAFLDCDDVWPAGRLRPMLAQFERDPTLECVFGQVVNTGPDLRPIGQPGLARLHTAMLIRRDAARAIGDFRTDVAHGSTVDWISRALSARAEVRGDRGNGAAAPGARRQSGGQGSRAGPAGHASGGPRSPLQDPEVSSPQLTSRELLLLNAALNPDARAAVAGWQQWSEQVALEEAPHPELRLLPKVFAHLSRIAPETELPQKLRGKARATFARNQAITHGAIPALRALADKVPVMAVKGLAVCAQFDAWASRPMGDTDIYVPLERLRDACAILRQAGWTPKYGMTWPSLQRRAPFRRDSWNLANGQSDLDLHWRFFGLTASRPLERALWAEAHSVQVLGHPCLIPSAEFSLAAALAHGFLTGTRGDLLQSVVDCAAWLPQCDLDRLDALLARARLHDAYDALRGCLAAAGRPLPRPGAPAAPPTQAPVREPVAAPAVERAVLARPALYRLWDRLGRRDRLERWLIRLLGPLSRPLGATGQPGNDYDLRDCAVIDQIGGPGWGWPEPEHTCFWSDGADNRLLLPLPARDDYIIALTLAPARGHSPNRRLGVFANGTPVGTLTMALGRSDYAFAIPRAALSGNWVDLAFRPEPYRGRPATGPAYGLRRSLPASRLRLWRAAAFPGVDAGQSDMPRRPPAGDAVRLAKFERARETIATSPYRTDPRLPGGFDPGLYLLVHTDVLDAEVDPFRHFLEWGMGEGRVW